MLLSKEVIQQTIDTLEGNANPINYSTGHVALETFNEPIGMHLEGYLMKRSAHLKVYRKRWIVLHNRKLLSYKTNQKKKLTEIFDLSEYECDVNSTDCAFYLTAHNKTRAFKADNDANMLKWVKYIKHNQIFSGNDADQDANIDIIDSVEARRLLKIMKEYNIHYNTIDKLNINISLIQEDFLQILTYCQKMAKHRPFEKISHELGKCDFGKCDIFKRNFRYRCDKKTNALYQDKEDVCIQQILDKIHCFYQHSEDIGNAVSSSEIDDIIVDNSEFTCDNMMQNDAIKSLNDILMTKREKCLQVEQINCRFQRYKDQLKADHCVEKKSDNDDSSDKMYKTGNFFNYKDEGEPGWKILPKYSSVKEELIANRVLTIHVQQFNTEYRKAGILFDSKYRKEFYYNMAIQHILALMIYCNFTNLSCELSKTYRGAVENHFKFFHWGKSLRDAVNCFGAEMKKKDRVYHGIDEQLSFPEVAGSDYRCAVNIFTPLSTSTSFPVAVNFSANNGLVVEISSYATGTKGFSCCWLSDFGNEFEQLFLQNPWPIKICNIVDVRTGYQYDIIIWCLRCVKHIIGGGEKYIDESGLLLINQIMQDQLSDMTNNYKQFKSLTDYARQMINIFCQNQHYVDINCEKLEQNLKFWSLFIDLKDSGIKVGVLNALFPNIEKIRFENPSNTEFYLPTLDRILIHLNNNTIKSKLNDMSFQYYEDVLLTISEEHKKGFDKIGFAMYDEKNAEENKTVFKWKGHIVIKRNN